jgi:hypothetical protein
MQNFNAIRSFPAVLVTLLLAACGGGGGGDGGGAGGGSPPVITVGSLPAGATGVAYVYTLTVARGGTAPFTWNATGTLPEGLLIGTDGQLSGIPVTAGTFSVPVIVTDSSVPARTATASFQLVVDASPLIINAGSTPPAGTVSYPYSFGFSASGGSAPFLWGATGPLPAGLTLDANGILCCTPTNVGSFAFTVTVTDSEATPATATAQFAVVVENPPPPTINIRSLPTGTVGAVYPALSFTASGGLAPLVWSESGTLPDLAVSLDGLLSGTPTSAGHFSIEVNVKDALNRTAAPAPFTVRISLPRPAGVFALTGSMAIARRGHTATLLESGKVLVAGGAGGPDVSAELYDPASGMFTATGNMTAARRGHTATLLTDAALPNHGKVLIVGGDSGDGGTSAELYDPVTEIFTAAGNATGVMIGHTATLLTDAALPNHGKVLLVAGGGTVAAELYDPASGTFTATGDLNYARTGHTATLLLDGRVLIAAGGTNGAELYDPANGTFKVTGPMSRVRSAGAMATRLADGSVLVAGTDNTAEIFDPATGTFALVGELLSGVEGATASLRNDEAVLVAGGWWWKTFYGSCSNPNTECRSHHYGRPDVRVSTTLAQSFAPESQGFTATGSLTAARHEHTATVLADGSTVLITGGVQYTASPNYHPTSAGHTVLSSAELFK